MSIDTLVKLSYFIAATLFLLGLQRMASPKTARSGIQWAGAGMVLATLATFFLPGLQNIALMLVAVALGFFVYRMAATAQRATARTLVVLVIGAFVLAFTSELLGRFLHYATMVRIGL